MFHFRMFIHTRNHGLYTHEITVFALLMVNSIHKESMPFLLHSALTRRLWGISDLTYIIRPPLEDVSSCLNILYPCTSNCASGKLSSILHHDEIEYFGMP